MSIRNVAAFFAACISLNSFAGITYEQLESLIETTRPASVEEFVSILPDEYRTDYSLVYDSQSIQQASYTHPRVISFGRDAKLLIAFNGSPEQRGYGTVEVIEFLENPARFEPRRLVWDKGAAVGPSRPLTERIVSEHSPAICASCHGVGLNFRPIYSDYFPKGWPGFYGSVKDFLDDFNSTSKREQKEFGKFMASSKSEGVYRALMDPCYIDIYFPHEWKCRPNLRLGKYLIRLSMKNAAEFAFLKEAPLYDRWLGLFNLICDLSEKDKARLNEILAKRDPNIPEADFAASSRFAVPLDSDYFDGSDDGIDFLIGEYFRKLMPEHPPLAKFYKEVLHADYANKKRKDFPDSRGYLATIDQVGTAVNLPLARRACPTIRKQLHSAMDAEEERPFSRK
jgi:hypothetical protein